jgi:acyl-coenzyme A synthetase/AMP-(fatty) acid ligase/acyl carrier protein
MDPAALVKLITEQEITTLHFVPSMLQLFLKEEDVGKCANLKRVICSGEALPYELQERFFERLNVELHNLYGPTEAAVDVTYWECQPGSDQRIVPIGKPVANTQMYVLDQLLQPVPIGVTGELHIGGVQVARGYLKRPELNKEKFIPDSFRVGSGARLYKTGDLARYLPDGVIEYLGRNDFQVKIRGLRIELGEIEAILDQYPDVSETVITAQNSMSGSKPIVAYFVARENLKVSIPDLRIFLTKKLPDYMVPSFFMQMEEFPLLPNGKVNRRALPEPTSDRPDLASSYVAPRSTTERMITRIWQAVLGIEKVGINDNFFDLGGHSLLLVSVSRQLRKQFDTDLKLFNLIEYPTIRLLAQYLNLSSDQNTPLIDIDDRVRKKKEKIAGSKRSRYGGRG